MGDELHLIKSQMQSLGTNVHALEQMKNLQNRARDLKVIWKTGVLQLCVRGYKETESPHRITVSKSGSYTEH